jgi:hypothetical protein
MAHLAMFVIFNLDVIFSQNFNLSHLSHFYWKKSFFEMIF